MQTPERDIIHNETLINTSQARAVVVVKEMGKKDQKVRCYYTEEGTWTRNMAQAKRFHNFRTATEVQRALRGDDSCLIR
jgi:arginine deiminase